MVAEVVMDHLARTVGKSSAAMRELNLYKEGDTTHFGQSLEGCQVHPGPTLPPVAVPPRGMLLTHFTLRSA